MTELLKVFVKRRKNTKLILEKLTLFFLGSFESLRITYKIALSVRLILCIHMWSDNKVRKLATVCLPWQHWTKALVWFDDVNISVFHSCVFVDLWQSLSERHLLLSACVLVRRTYGHSESVGLIALKLYNVETLKTSKRLELLFVIRQF
jgi:hypothetical protein